MSKKSREMISKLTLEEKCALCAQAEGSFGRVDRLGLKGSIPQDNPRGGKDYFRSGRPRDGDGEYHPVAFPSNAALAMSWDEDLAFHTGEVFARECRANPEPIGWLFRPGVNIKRSPLCGRNFEYFSEDPVLSGELAGSYIRGLQSLNVAATLKHFICNNQEFERMTTNVVVSERALREVYLRPFEIAIRKGDPWSVMSSYNQVNGEWVNSNRHVCDLLRDEIGYDGVVVSDFAAVHRTKAQAHNCGMMDIELAPVCVHTQELIDAVKNGEVREETLDRGLERVFDLMERISPIASLEADMEALHVEAARAAEQCIVLLKNDGILPLDEKQMRGRKVLVAGKLAEDPSYMGGGSGHMNGYRIDTYLDELRKVIPDLVYTPGYQLMEGFPPEEPAVPELIREAFLRAQESDVILVFAGLGYCYESEGYDRSSIALPEGQRLLLDELVKTGKPIILVLSCASVLDITRWEDQVAAIVYNSLGGEAVAPATVNILFGAAEPGGRLAESWPVCEEHTPAYMNFTRQCQDQPDVIYGEDIYVGYRWYEKRKLPVLFPFGHGLSYTDFEIGKPVLSKQSISVGETVELTISVQNTGSRPGSEVLQLYVSWPETSVMDHPLKELKAFAKVHLDAWETKYVVLKLPANSLRCFSASQNRWILESGVYRLSLGVSSAKILHETYLMLTDGSRPVVYTEMTPLAWFVASDQYHAILREYYPPEIDEMMNQETFEWCCLCMAMPFYKVAEGFLDLKLSKKDIDFILNRMNEVNQVNQCQSRDYSRIDIP